MDFGAGFVRFFSYFQIRDGFTIVVFLGVDMAVTPNR